MKAGKVQAAGRKFASGDSREVSFHGRANIVVAARQGDSLLPTSDLETTDSQPLELPSKQDRAPIVPWLGAATLPDALSLDPVRLALREFQPIDN